MIYSRKLLLLLVGLLALANVPFVLGGDDDAGDDAGDDGKNGDDDDYIDLSNEDFDQVSIMPVSCVN